MDKQRRYEVRNIAERLDKIVSELNDLADEEKPEWSLSGRDSKRAHKEMRSVADTIGIEIEKLYRVAEVPPKFQIVSGR